LSLWSPLDWVAFALFITGWVVYGYLADRASRSATGLRGVTHVRRLEWARQMTDRVPGTRQSNTKVVTEWTCPECDYFEEVEES